MEFKELVKKRESVRMFKSDKLEKNIINNILEYGRLAPSAKNNQPTRILVAQTDDALNKIDECSICRYNAPVVLIICAVIIQ